MELRDVIKGDKRILSDTGWCSGKLKKSQYPLSKHKGLKLGSQWDWRIIRFEVEGVQFRLLVAHNPAKLLAQSYLGAELSGDTAILARYEFHATHGGWHAHTRCHDPVNAITPGIAGGNSFDRLASKYCSAPTNKEQVLGYAFERVKLSKETFELTDGH